MGMLISGFVEELMSTFDHKSPVWEKQHAEGGGKPLLQDSAMMLDEWGPCLEFLLKHQVLETLVNFAERDVSTTHY
jgi:hypothetical protein